MDNKSLLLTYKVPLILQRDDMQLNGGLCLSKVSFKELYAMRDSFLHPKEHLHFTTLQYQKRQQSYLLGRYCAKHAIAVQTNHTDLVAIHIDNGIFQQPIVNYPQHPNIQISITHTDTIAAALSFPEAHPVAIDIETINNNKSKILKTQLTPAEQMLSVSEITKLTLLWTAKEALSKVLKCGLMVPFELLEVETLMEHDRFTIGHFKNFHQYKVLSFLIAEAVCSIVYPKKTRLKLDIVAIQQLFDGEKT